MLSSVMCSFMHVSGADFAGTVLRSGKSGHWPASRCNPTHGAGPTLCANWARPKLTLRLLLPMFSPMFGSRACLPGAEQR